MKHQKKQKCFQQEGFFALGAFALQSARTTDCKILPRWRAPRSPPFCKYCYALPARWPTLFCLPSPEAYLLTFKNIMGNGMMQLGTAAMRSIGDCWLISQTQRHQKIGPGIGR